MTLRRLERMLYAHDPPRAVNQYRDHDLLTLLSIHLESARGETLCVGESPASVKQAVAFTDGSRSSKVFNEVLGGARFARLNAYPFYLGRGVKPNTVELATGAWLLEEAVAELEPNGIVAVGRVADHALTVAGARHVYVPHPAQDKAPIFRQQMGEIVARRCAPLGARYG